MQAALALVRRQLLVELGHGLHGQLALQAVPVGALPPLFEFSNRLPQTRTVFGDRRMRFRGQPVGEQREALLGKRAEIGEAAQHVQEGSQGP